MKALGVHHAILVSWQPPKVRAICASPERWGDLPLVTQLVNGRQSLFNKSNHHALPTLSRPVTLPALCMCSSGLALSVLRTSPFLGHFHSREFLMNLTHVFLWPVRKASEREGACLEHLEMTLPQK